MVQSIATIARGHDVWIDWYYDQQISIVRLETYSRAGVDAAVEALLDLILNWDTRKPYLNGLQVSAQILVTPYSRQRFGETANRNPALSGRYVLILPRSIVSTSIKMFFNYEYKRRANPQLEGKAFNEHDAAIAWLAELLPSAQTQGSASVATDEDSQP